MWSIISWLRRKLTTLNWVILKPLKYLQVVYNSIFLNYEAKVLKGNNWILKFSLIIVVHWLKLNGYALISCCNYSCSANRLRSWSVCFCCILPYDSSLIMLMALTLVLIHFYELIQSKRHPITIANLLPLFYPIHKMPHSGH